MVRRKFVSLVAPLLTLVLTLVCVLSLVSAGLAQLRQPLTPTGPPMASTLARSGDNSADSVTASNAAGLKLHWTHHAGGGIFSQPVVSNSSGKCSGARGTATSTTATPKPTATPHVVHYPPTTQADLRGLAAKGDASAIHPFDSESVGLVGLCPQPKREVTVDLKLTGQQLAEDLLAYFYGEQLTSPCGSIVLAYHNQSEANDAYTAGRVNLDVTDSTGDVNVDPNATNLKYTITLDIGGNLSNQEYIVTY